MRRRLGALVALVAIPFLLVGCGEESSTTADDPAPAGATSPPASTPGSTSTEPGGVVTGPVQPTKAPPITPSTGPVGFTVVALEHATAAGGRDSDGTVRVGPGGDTEGFLRTLSDGGLRDTLRGRIDAAPPGGELYAAVVGLGCDVPDEVSVTPTTAGYDVRAVPSKPSTQECFAPVTTVAVVRVRR